MVVSSKKEAVAERQAEERCYLLVQRRELQRASLDAWRPVPADRLEHVRFTDAGGPLDKHAAYARGGGTAAAAAAVAVAALRRPG